MSAALSPLSRLVAAARPLCLGLLALLWGVLMTPACLAAASQADIDTAKQQGADIARGLQGSPSVDSQGNVRKTPSGQVATTGNSSSSAQGQLSLMQSLMGTTGFKGAGDPGAKGQTFGGTTTQTTSVDIPCTLSPGSIRSAGGVQFAFQGCQITGGVVASLSAEICADLNSGGTCSPGDYSAVTVLTANAYTSVKGLQIGVGCTDSIRVCRVTVTSTSTVASSASQLTAQAQQSQTAHPNATQSALSTLVNSKEYQDQKTEQQATAQCYSQNQQSFEQNGQVSTCNGKQSVVVTGGPAGGSCKPTQTCTQPTTTVRTWNTSCTRTFPLTTYSCQTTTPTLTCVDSSSDRRGKQVNSSTCTDAQRAGGTLISSSAKCLSRSAPIPGEPGTECTGWQVTKTYVFPGQATNSNCVASPLPLAGPFSSSICATTLTDTQASCAANGWVGRTLSDQQCQVSSVDPSTGATVFSQLSYKQKPGCGYCAAQTTGYSCQGKPPLGPPDDTCANTDLSACTLTNVSAQTQAYGITTSQTETYSCSQTTTSCAAWQTTSTCINGDASYGVSSMPVQSPGDNGSFQQVLQDGAVAEGIAKSGTANSPTNARVNPKIFDGQDLRCRKPLGFIGGVINNDCCQTSLTRTGGSHVGTSCTQNEVTLAAARRAKFDVFIGTYCSKKTNYLFFSRCDEQTQTYCTFQGILPRLVQVQGRQQLQAMASSSTTATLQTAPLSFAYYAGSGGWTAPITVNGVQVAAYQQPGYCSSAQASSAAFAANPNAQECPATLDVYLASCELPGGCGALPNVPQASSGSWVISDVDPLKLVSTALSSHAIAKGGCDTTSQQCAYQVSAWPAGSGGRAMVSRDVSFSLYTPNSYSGGEAMASIGAVLFRPVIDSTSQMVGSLPSTVPAQVSVDSGSTWTPLALPTQITSNYTLPGTDVTVTGGCVAATGVCDYKLIGSIDITAKPWGSATQPDCSGFTLDQFTSLDMGKMDLSEWVQSISRQITPPSGSTLAAQAQQQAAAGNSYTAPNPSPAQSVILSPTEGLGPFSVTLSATGNWPQMAATPAGNTDPVAGVDIDWGDCSGPDRAAMLPSGGFAAQHLYAAPGTAGICDTSGSAGATPRNLVHQVLVTLHSLTGAHQVSLKVRNDFTDYSSP